MMRVETARLVIRSFEAKDAEAWIAMLNEPRVRRFLPAFPIVAKEDFDAMVARREKMQRELGYTLWAVALKETDALIGQCGAVPAEGKGPEVEVVYHFSPESWNQGYATEAVTAVLGHVFQSTGVHRLIAIVLPENIGSQRVAEKLGMRFEGKATYYDIAGVKKYVANRA